MFLGIDVRDNNRQAPRTIATGDVPVVYDPAMRTLIAFGGKYPTPASFRPLKRRTKNEPKTRCA